jgi:RNA-binding protein
MSLTSKERAALRAEAHHLTASVHVGQHGLTEALRQSVDDALRTHVLVKLQFTRNSPLEPREAANDLASTLAADVVQVIGKTATLFRENPELEQKGGVPPWKR